MVKRSDVVPHAPQTADAVPTTRRRVLQVTVLCGGPSAEREVSLDSGRAVAEALRRRGHQVFTADIGPENLAALDHPAEVVFPALHGPFGEDGTIQRIMAERGLRFVGADARASALAMDKVASKQAVAAAGIDTPAFEVWNQALLATGSGPAIGLPVIVKPVDQGSSVATTIVREPAAFLPAVRLAVGRFGRALVERLVIGEEVTVGIVGQEALPPICVRPKRDFYDYRAKYQDDATEYLFDAGTEGEDDLRPPSGVFERAQALSRRVFEIVGCRHLARVDWMVDGDERLWFLEINTLPGFTSHSLVPKAAARAGTSFDELVERLVWMALEDAP
jgi:D-alanine-D-alanine ligase